MAGNTQLYQRSPMPVNYVRNLVELMTASGISSSRLLSEAGLTHEQVFGSEAQLRFAQFRAVMLAGRKLSGDSAIGLKLGQKLMLTAHGLLGYAVISSANLGEAMTLLQRYFCTRTRLCAPSFEANGREGTLRFHEMMELGDIRQTYLEVMVAAVVSTMRFLLGETVSRCRLILPYVKPPHGDSYTSLLGLPVDFEGLTLSLTIPQSLLDAPFPMADAASREQAAAKCEEELQRLEADQDMEARVRQQLMQAEVTLPSVEELATRFHMTSRTLRRRLEAAKTSYQGILDDVRRLRAVRYLASNHSVQQVAWLLGYADPSNFSRAFRKWTGQSPSTFLAHGS
jgi:AraC-like DNA-binding protein